jgi:hypothetical protein
MNVKRFVQLFICYLVSMAVAVFVSSLFHFSSMFVFILVAAIIGYVTLTIPLVIMTLLKNK